MDFPQPDLLAPSVDSEDIQQEIELLKLTGVENPSRAIVALRLGQFREFLYADTLPLSAVAMDFAVVVPDISVFEQILEWAVVQTDTVQSRVIGFLDDPTDEALAILLEDLELSGVILPPQPQETEMPFSKLLLRQLAKQPMTKQEMIDFAREELGPRRPDATIRQYLRRWLDTWTVVQELNEEGEYVYRIANPRSDS